MGKKKKLLVTTMVKETGTNLSRISSNPIKMLILFVVFSIFFASLCGDLINIRFSPGALHRDDIRAYSVSYILKPILLTFLMLCFTPLLAEKSSSTEQRYIAYGFFLCLPLSIFLNGLAVSAPISKYLLYSQFGLMLLGYFLVHRKSFRNIVSRPLLSCLFFASALFIGYFSYYVFSRSLFTFRLLSDISVSQPQYHSGIFQSTEFSNLLALTLILGLMITSRQRPRTALFVAYSVTCALLFILICYMFSIGTFVALTIVSLLSLIRGRILRPGNLLIILSAIGLGLLLMEMLGLTDLFHHVYNLKLNEPRRNYTYSMLWKYITLSPVWGYGVHQSYETFGFYAHQNILGLWAESGILSAIAYISFTIVALLGYVTYKKAVQPNSVFNRSDVQLIYMGFCVYGAMFLHIKGLAQDTWYEEALFLFTGSILGFLQLRRNHVKGGTNNSRDGLIRRLS